MDKDLIELLLSDNQIKEVFFTQVGKAAIFDRDKFIRFVSNKQFLLESLDKNHLYINYSEIEDEEYDEEYRVSKENKRLNREFYLSAASR